MSSLDAAAAGRRLGRYHLAEPLGGGPTGEVYRAKVYGVAGFERQFAVKRFHKELVRDPDVAAELATATRMYGSLEHPRIARLHEYGVAGGETFTAVELVEGIDLSRLVGTSWGMGEPLLAGAAAALVSQLARAIGYAHGRGITHLGVCPTNLIATPAGDVKVTDFGVLPPRLPSKPGNDPTLVARIGYLAPEQLVGEETSAATDVFQIGAVAYELFTGDRCFRGSTSFDIAQTILSSQPATPPLPKPLIKVLLRCLARSPFERFPDAGAFADALDAAVRSTPLPGAKRDISTAVTAAVEKIAQMNKGQASGALSFPLPAPPPSMPFGGPGDRASTELTEERPTIPRKTMMGAGVGDPPFKIPDIVPQLPARDDHEDNAPTTIRERQQGMLQPIATPAAGRPPSAPPVPAVPAPPGFAPPRPASEPSMPEIELSLSDLEVPGDSQVVPLANLEVGDVTTPRSPSAPAAMPAGRLDSTGSLGSLDDPTPLPAPMPHDDLPEALPLMADPSGSYQLQPGPSQPPPRSRGRGLLLGLGLVLFAGIGAGGYFGYQHLTRDDGTQVAEARTNDAPADPAAKPAVDPKAADPAVDPKAADPAVDPKAADALDAGAASDDPDGDEQETAAEPGKLLVTSEPAGARVYVDGTYKGKTPMTADGVSDQVSIAVILPGYKLYTATISGTGGHKVELAEVTPPDGPAGIKVRCKQKNRYYVIVDGNDVGQLCPTERIGVEKGDHEVVVYDPETEQRRSFRIEIKQTRNSYRVYVDR